MATQGPYYFKNVFRDTRIFGQIYFFFAKIPQFQNFPKTAIEKPNDVFSL